MSEIPANSWWMVEYMLQQGFEPLGQFSLHVPAPSRGEALCRAERDICEGNEIGMTFQVTRVETLSPLHAAYVADGPAGSWWSLAYKLVVNNRRAGCGHLLARVRPGEIPQAVLEPLLFVRYTRPGVTFMTGELQKIELPEMTVGGSRTAPALRSPAEQADRRERRERIATALLQGMFAGGRNTTTNQQNLADTSRDAVRWANALMEQLDQPKKED